MAKKQPSWRKQAEKAQAEAGGNASFFWTAELDEWHTITVDPSEIEVRLEEDSDWKKRTYCLVNSGEGYEEEEIPFWCTDDFFDELLSSDESAQTVVMDYKRTKKGGVNKGKFRLSED